MGPVGGVSKQYQFTNTSSRHPNESEKQFEKKGILSSQYAGGAGDGYIQHVLD